MPRKKVDRVKELTEPWFFFSLVWSVGCTGDAASRERFSTWLRNKMAEEKVVPASLLWQPDAKGFSIVMLVKCFQ